MLGLGETMEQVQATLRDLRAHDVEMVTHRARVPAAERAPPSCAALLDAGRVQGTGNLRLLAGFLASRGLGPDGVRATTRPAGGGGIA